MCVWDVGWSIQHHLTIELLSATFVYFVVVGRDGMGWCVRYHVLLCGITLYHHDTSSSMILVLTSSSSAPPSQSYQNPIPMHTSGLRVPLLTGMNARSFSLCAGKWVIRWKLECRHEMRERERGKKRAPRNLFILLYPHSIWPLQRDPNGSESLPLAD